MELEARKFSAAPIGRVLRAAAAAAILGSIILADLSAQADELRQMLPGGPRLQTAPFKNFCAVSLRVLEGDQRVEESTMQKIRTGEALVDVGEQLQALPFKSFRLLGSTERSVTLGDEAVFNVVAANQESHSIHIVPSELKNGKVGVSLNWYGPEGENLLDTKLMFTNGENILLGSEGAGDASSILCLKIRCN